MSFTFKCDHCGKFLKAEYEQQKEQLPCPKCGKNVVVPIEVGPCPKCSVLLDNYGTRWHISLLVLCIGGVVTLAILHGSFRERDTLFILLGIVIGVATIFMALRYIKLRYYRCPSCKTWIRAWRKVQWSENAGENNCPVCKGKLTSKEKLYKSMALIMLLFAGYFVYHGILGSEDSVVNLLDLGTAGIIILMAALRWRYVPYGCKNCKVTIY